MNQIQEQVQRAQKVAKSFYLQSKMLTVPMLKTLLVSASNNITFTATKIIVPLHVFNMMTKEAHDVRVIINRQNFEVTGIIR